MRIGATAQLVMRVDKLRVDLFTRRQRACVVDRISFDVGRGGTLGLVGESGSGKSITCRAVLGLLPRGMNVTEGSITFDGTDLRGLHEKKLANLRGKRIGFIPQDPLAGLNPVRRVGDQVAETYSVHRVAKTREANERAVELLSRVGIPQAKERARAYPHQFSGGMRQRVLIAMAIAHEPDLLLADEPTTALDVTVQLQILKLIADLQEAAGMSLVLVTHNFALVGGMCDEVAVMYGGRLLETGATEDVLSEPLHPYTDALLAAMPHLSVGKARTKLRGIPGSQPRLGEAVGGCVFRTRCGFSDEPCRSVDMSLIEKRTGHWSACPFRPQ